MSAASKAGHVDHGHVDHGHGHGHGHADAGSHGSFRDYMTGFVLSVILMGVASSFVANLMERYKWIAWAGLAIIVYVALDMIVSGGEDVLQLAHLGV